MNIAHTTLSLTVPMPKLEANFNRCHNYIVHPTRKDHGVLKDQCSNHIHIKYES